MPVQKKEQNQNGNKHRNTKIKGGALPECGAEAEVVVKVGDIDYSARLKRITGCEGNAGRTAAPRPEAVTSGPAAGLGNAGRAAAATPAALVSSPPPETPPGATDPAPGHDILELDLSKRQEFVDWVDSLSLSQKPDIKKIQIYPEDSETQPGEGYLVDSILKSYKDFGDKDIKEGDVIQIKFNIKNVDDTTYDLVDCFQRVRKLDGNWIFVGGARRKAQKKKNVQEKVLYKKDAKHQPTRPSLVHLNKSGRKFIKVNGTEVYLDTIRGKYRYVK